MRQFCSDCGSLSADDPACQSGPPHTCFSSLLFSALFCSALLLSALLFLLSLTCPVLSLLPPLPICSSQSAVCTKRDLQHVPLACYVLLLCPLLGMSMGGVLSSAPSQSAAVMASRQPSVSHIVLCIQSIFSLVRLPACMFVCLSVAKYGVLLILYLALKFCLSMTANVSLAGFHSNQSHSLV